MVESPRTEAAMAIRRWLVAMPKAAAAPITAAALRVRIRANSRVRPAEKPAVTLGMRRRDFAGLSN